MGRVGGEDPFDWAQGRKGESEKIMTFLLEIGTEELPASHAASAIEQLESAVPVMLDVYADFAINEAAIPVVQGKKSEREKFAGAISMRPRTARELAVLKH